MLLAAFDVVGEFIARGGPLIVITVSFVVALALLVLGHRELRSPSAGPALT